MPQLGERLKKARIAKGLTLEALAGETCTAAHVHKVEAGQVCPSPRVLAHLCTALELPLHEVASHYFGLCRNPGYVLSMCETLRAEGKAEVSLPVVEALAGDRARRPAKPEVLLELARAHACLGRMAETEDALLRAASQANAASRRPIVGKTLLGLG
ncbi:MAG: helix-turn-helix transcriptional regulator [Firmicutes bacterium]|nr:helix-turn-helix transcriptional regulator [Bacillota bacterium]